MHNDSLHGFDAAQTEYEAFMLKPHDWVPNNRKLPVVIYRRALMPDSGDLGAAFEILFERNAWPTQWRDGIFDYHHFHATAHEILGVTDGSAQVIVGGPGGTVVTLFAGARPERVERLVSIEGLGPPDNDWSMGPVRMRRWLELSESAGA